MGARWHKEPPTESGLYWYFWGRGNIEFGKYPNLVAIDFEKNTVETLGREDSDTTEEHFSKLWTEERLWYGPIAAVEPPALPKRGT